MEIYLAAFFIVAILLLAALCLWYRKRKKAREEMGVFQLMAEKIERDAKRRYHSKDLDFPMPPRSAGPRANPIVVAARTAIPAGIIAVPPLAYYWIVVLAVVSAIWFFWYAKADFEQAKKNANADGSTPKSFMAFTVVLLVVALGICFLALQSAVYFGVLGLSSLLRTIA